MDEPVREQMLSTIRTFFLRNDKGYPVACIATLINDPKEPSIALFSVATCNPKDQFSKDWGRHIATSRLEKAKGISMVKFGSGLHRTIVQKIADTSGYPMRTRRAALSWLASHTPINNDPKLLSASILASM